MDNRKRERERLRDRMRARASELANKSLLLD